MSEPRKTAWWTCGYGHRFPWGNEDWHWEDDSSQYVTDAGYPVPRYCQHEDDGEPCMDSSELNGPDPTP